MACEFCDEVRRLCMKKVREGLYRPSQYLSADDPLVDSEMQAFARKLFERIDNGN